MDFEYTPTSVVGRGFEYPNSTEQCCDCEFQCSSLTGCSCLPFGENYDENGLLFDSSENYANSSKLWADFSIFECNDACKCTANAKCRNRLVQYGVNLPVEIFSTLSGKNYGLRCGMPLRRGQFVCEYAGELIGLEEARSRFSQFSKNSSNYIFILRENLHNGDQIVTCIDATTKGNIGRFANHSCEPNLHVLPVRCGTHSIPRLALFCLKDVEVGQELCYSYGPSSQQKKSTAKNCLCFSKNCPGKMPVDEAFVQ